MRASLKPRLLYASLDHEAQWRAHAAAFPLGYLRSFLAFKALGNLLGLQPRHDRRGGSMLKSRNSCPRLARSRVTAKTAAAGDSDFTGSDAAGDSAGSPASRGSSKRSASKRPPRSAARQSAALGVGGEGPRDGGLCVPLQAAQLRVTAAGLTPW